MASYLPRTEQKEIIHKFLRPTKKMDVLSFVCEYELKQIEPFLPVLV